VRRFGTLHFRPLQLEAFGGAQVLNSTHASDQVERIRIEAAFLEDVVLKVNADDFPDHQTSARGLRSKINDAVELALELTGDSASCGGRTACEGRVFSFATANSSTEVW
jgi:hypothetical protein